jgi:protein O-GlcNAc transferase
VDYERFLRELPGLYEGWGTLQARPRSRRFDQVLAVVQGMTTPGVLQLLNLAVGCLEGEEAYGEVGTFRGATLIGAMLDHPARRAEAVDNFSEFDPGGVNRAALLRHLELFHLTGRVRFHEEDFERYLLGRRARAGPKFGVYLYDGAHDYRSQLMGLLLAVPHLAGRGLLVVDDANCAAAQQASADFLAACPQSRVLLELPTPGNGHPSFWNGLLVLAWDENCRDGCDYEALSRRRRRALVESIYALQHVGLKREGNVIRLVEPE